MPLIEVSMLLFFSRFERKSNSPLENHFGSRQKKIYNPESFENIGDMSKGNPINFSDHYKAVAIFC